ncbi:MAG TPA: glycosyltransferase family 9 protein [Ktedonobacterales bacterium]|nr:glycosyltransferase family 9 protein [Ktedonobacterales bacterium]
MDAPLLSLPPRPGHGPRKIAVVRPGALGDTLLTLPALAALRRWAPDASLTFIARADTLPVAYANGLADALWSWDLPDWSVLFASQPGALTERARAALVGADVVIVWAPDPDGAVERRLRALGVETVIVAPGRPPEDAAGAAAQVHAAVWLTDTLAPLGIPPQTRESLTALTAPLRTDAPHVAEADALWRGLRLPERVIALHSGSGSPRKRWPADRFAEVARLVDAAGYGALLLAGEADARALAETREAMAGLRAHAALAQGVSTPTLAALLARCAGYVGCDSGVSHLAGLVGAPTVAVFGPTDPARWAPLGPQARALRSPDGLLGSLRADAVWADLHALIAGTGGE